ncbi:MAG: hypothetical protein AAFY76_20455 [Cyanobacteria bacterium J06649_11]
MSDPLFYKRFVDDIITRRKIGVHDELYEALNKYHQKLKLTIEVNPSKFLDTSIKINNNTISTSVHLKETKLPIPWSSKVPQTDCKAGYIFKGKPLMETVTSAPMLIEPIDI